MATEHLSACNLCEAACGIRVTLDGGHVTQVRGDPDDLLSHGHICAKAIGLGELLSDPDRLRFPLLRRHGQLQRATWDEALQEIVDNIREIQDNHGPDAVAFYVGNPVVHSHRASLAAQLLTMAIGSKNRFDPNSQDSNPRLFTAMQMYGDALSMAVPDVDRCDFLLMLGANPAASNGSQVGLGDAKSRLKAIAQRGQLILVDPRRTETAAWCTQHHFITPGGDCALLLAMLQVLFAENLLDLAKISAIALDLAGLKEIARNYPPERVAKKIGIAAPIIRQLARDLACTPRACVYARVGVSQSEFGPLGCWLVEALNVVTGHFDTEGGMMFPLPAADIAPLGRVVVGNQFGRWQSRVRHLPEFLGALPSAVLSEEIETPGVGQIRALIVLAGNPVLSTPNGARLAKMLPKLDFMASIDFYLNETTQHSHVIVPPKHIFETGNYDLILSRFYVRNLARYTQKILQTSDDTRDEWQIAVDLALRLRLPDLAFLAPMLNKLPEKAIDLLLRFGPHKLTLQKLRDNPQGYDFGPLQPSFTRCVRTPFGKIHLTPQVFIDDLPRLEKWLLDDSPQPLKMIGRRHLRDNNSWMHNLPSVAKGPDRARVMLHPHDAQVRKIADGQEIQLQSRVGTLTTRAQVTPDIMQGVVSLPHGFGHQEAVGMQIASKMHGISANALTDEQRVEAVMGNSILTGVPVQLRAVQNAQ